MNLSIEPLPWTPERLEEVRAAFDGHKSQTSEGIVGPTEYVERGVFNRMSVDGEPVGFYVLFAWTHEKGTEVEISHTHAKCQGLDVVKAFLPLIEQQCKGADSLRVITRRRGLIKKLQAQGYGIESVTMRKRGKHDSAA